VVPVAGQDAVSDGSPMQGEPHVGAAVVHCIYPAVVEEERERTTIDANGEAACGAHIV
jgi:hypothetical protein